MKKAKYTFSKIIAFFTFILILTNNIYYFYSIAKEYIYNTKNFNAETIIFIFASAFIGILLVLCLYTNVKFFICSWNVIINSSKIIVKYFTHTNSIYWKDIVSIKFDNFFIKVETIDKNLTFTRFLYMMKSSKKEAEKIMIESIDKYNFSITRVDSLLLFISKKGRDL